MYVTTVHKSLSMILMIHLFMVPIEINWGKKVRPQEGGLLIGILEIKRQDNATQDKARQDKTGQHNTTHV
jgi:hypothetical protein